MKQSERIAALEREVAELRRMVVDLMARPVYVPVPAQQPAWPPLYPVICGDVWTERPFTTGQPTFGPSC